MKNEILVNGEYTLTEFRKVLDRQSRIPGLPDLLVHEPKPEMMRSLEEARIIFAEAGLQYRIQNAIDGMVELIPTISTKSPTRRNNGK